MDRKSNSQRFKIKPTPHSNSSSRRTTAAAPASALGRKQVQQPVRLLEKIPFDSQAFVDFVRLLARMFYDDATIVLLDFLGREQKSFLLSELKEQLGWREPLIQQKLYLLERHMVTVQDLPIHTGPRTQPHWRINHQVYGAVRWRYQEIVSRLDKLVADASKQHEFECSKRSCEAKYSALEAASCSRTLDDEHPLCVECGSPLKQSELEETKQLAKKKRARAIQLLQPLNQGLMRIERMEIPTFPQFKKKDKEQQQQQQQLTASEGSLQQQQLLASTTAATATGVSPQQEQTGIAVGPVAHAPVSSSALDSVKAFELALKKSSPHPLTSLLGLSGAADAAKSAAHQSRSVPWFERDRGIDSDAPDDFYSISNGFHKPNSSGTLPGLSSNDQEPCLFAESHNSHISTLTVDTSSVMNKRSFSTAFGSTTGTAATGTAKKPEIAGRTGATTTGTTATSMSLSKSPAAKISFGLKSISKLNSNTTSIATSKSLLSPSSSSSSSSSSSLGAQTHQHHSHNQHHQQSDNNSNNLGCTSAATVADSSSSYYDAGHCNDDSNDAAIKKKQRLLSSVFYSDTESEFSNNNISSSNISNNNISSSNISSNNISSSSSVIDRNHQYGILTNGGNRSTNHLANININNIKLTSSSSITNTNTSSTISTTSNNNNNNNQQKSTLCSSDVYQKQHQQQLYQQQLYQQQQHQQQQHQQLYQQQQQQQQQLPSQLSSAAGGGAWGVNGGGGDYNVQNFNVNPQGLSQSIDDKANMKIIINSGGNCSGNNVDSYNHNEGKDEDDENDNNNDYYDSSHYYDYSDHHGEVEIEVSQLNKKFKLSEITDEIEQMMTDEEYKIYYNSTGPILQ